MSKSAIHKDAWNRYQAFTPIAERFLQQLKVSFENGTVKRVLL